MHQNKYWQGRKKLWSGSLFIMSILTALFVVFTDSRAFAHGVTIFAWVDGDIIRTISKFSGGKRVKNSDVKVFDTEGNQLLEGKTDENGEFSFTIPKKTDLRSSLKHQWDIWHNGRFPPKNSIRFLLFLAIAIMFQWQMIPEKPLLM
jgi:hypothetical protein